MDSGEFVSGRKMLSTTCEGVGAAPGRAGAEPVEEGRSNGHGGAERGQEGRGGFGAQEWPDGSRYEGGFVNGFKHGSGRYTWRNGEVTNGKLKVTPVTCALLSLRRLTFS